MAGPGAACAEAVRKKGERNAIPDFSTLQRKAQNAKRLHQYGWSYDEIGVMTDEQLEEAAHVIEVMEAEIGPENTAANAKTLVYIGLKRSDDPKPEGEQDA